MTASALTITDLQSWVLSGGHWRIVEIAKDRTVVDLCSCTGEPMERGVVEDPGAISYLRAAPADPTAAERRRHCPG